MLIKPSPNENHHAHVILGCPRMSKNEILYVLEDFKGLKAKCYGTTISLPWGAFRPLNASDLFLYQQIFHYYVECSCKQHNLYYFINYINIIVYYFAIL